MGIFGHHNNSEQLKNSAEKLVKFKQKLLIDAARTQERISKEHYETTKDGACAAFAMEWCADRLDLAPFGLSKFERGQSTPSKHTPATAIESHLAIVAHATPAFVEYDKNFKALGHDAVARKLATDLKLFLATPAVLTADLGYVVGQFYRLLFKECAAYVHANVAGVDSGHCLGLYKDNEGRLYFFDPNIGEYLIQYGKYERFMLDHLALVKTHLHIEYETAFGYEIALSENSFF
jgi:hypothetical protein